MFPQNREKLGFNKEHSIKFLALRQQWPGRAMLTFVYYYYYYYYYYFGTNTIFLTILIISLAIKLIIK